MQILTLGGFYIRLETICMQQVLEKYYNKYY